MSKIFLIARSELLRRVRSKTFVLTTLLAPLLIVAATLLPILVVVLTQDDTVRTVALVNQTGEPALADSVAAALPDGFRVVQPALPLDSLRARVLRGGLDGFLVLPRGLLAGTEEAAYYSRGAGLGAQEGVRSAVRDAVRLHRIRAAGATDAVIAALDAPVALSLVTVTERGDEADTAFVSIIVGMMMGLLIYIAVLIYGITVMRGVIEEKTSRIVEVIASSARPFELMMGKVLGIGATGLVQFATWGALLVVLGAVAGPLLALTMGAAADPAALGAGMPGRPPAPEVDPAALAEAIAAVLAPGRLLTFVAFFLGGYLLCAALFAAVGSAVEQESDAQTLQLPVMLPLLVPMFFLQYVIDRPDAPLSVGLSLFPFSAPMLMTVRMAMTAVPLWQVGLAFLLLALSFVGLIWVAARIYRVGILMYGKKATLRDLWRWARTP
ncbi:MAG TPA: ABC transporter permease [Rubricoccaceae bacterium]|nr:ABC transporter permease [Rubricoccaceae bacterium]